MDIKIVQLAPRPLESVEYTEQNAEEVRQWVQSNSTFVEIVSSGGRLYLPIDNGQGMDIVEYGEFVLHEAGTDFFTSCTAHAFHEFYEEV